MLRIFFQINGDDILQIYTHLQIKEYHDTKILPEVAADALVQDCYYRHSDGMRILIKKLAGRYLYSLESFVIEYALYRYVDHPTVFEKNLDFLYNVLYLENKFCDRMKYTLYDEARRFKIDRSVMDEYIECRSQYLEKITQFLQVSLSNILFYLFFCDFCFVLLFSFYFLLLFAFYFVFVVLLCCFVVAASTSC